MNVSALVLAAGKSSRIPGRQKLLLPLGNKPVLAHAVDNLLQSCVSEVIVVVGHGAEEIRAALGARPVRFVFNSDYAQGLSTSIKAGLAALSNGTQGVLFALGDMPLVEARDLDVLIADFARVPHATIAVPVFHGRRGNPVLFDIRLRTEMFELFGDVGCKALLLRHVHEVLEVEMPNDHVLRDVDTLAAYNELCASMEVKRG
ncbi:nucleotidyltransferase family protein [candidate division KSB1 bacterium]|nr:nucleotidyltransferase family protein [candidate division KSB1 bacterium]